MKIGFCVRNDFSTRLGGDSVQILNTKQRIEKHYKECIIDILTNSDMIDASYDIIHIFNLTLINDCIGYYEAAKKNKVKIAVSTIYWDSTFLAYHYIGKYFGYNINKCLYKFENLIVGLFANIIKHPYLLSKYFNLEAKKISLGSDLLLPNSSEELEILCRLAGTSLKEKSVIVYNAVDQYEKNEIEIDINVNKYVLQVGRIEPRKNQISVVRALYREKNIPIVFLGKIYPDQKEYYKKLKKISEERGNVYFFDEIEQKYINIFYKKAIVHILPSLQETTGLVSLEALSNCCKICVSNHIFTPTETYFKDIATIVDPLNLKSIHDGIINEINTVRDMSAISKYVLNSFNWDIAAKQTYDGYCSVMNKK